ncbi:MAG: response regulator [Deltaproteobacteria bacterium]|nr:response regulator [Deltaproteobacteria bacterium]
MTEVVPRSILIVDDEAPLRERLVRAMRDRGLDARGAADGDAAIALAREDSPELAVVDLRMPGRGGLDVVRELHTIDPSTRIVVLTGYGSIATAVEAMRLGAVHYLQKPADADEILAALARGEADAEAPTATAPTEVPSLARVEWEHIQRVMQDCDGNVSQAARLLGLHRRSLQRKLGKLPVRR